MLLHLQQLFHPNDPACLKENYAKARQKMTNMPRLLAELQQSVRERGQMPGWIEDFITPVENIKKSEDVKEESEEFEKDCGDEELEEERNPSEKEKVNEAGDLNGDGDQELEEERNASEKEKVNEAGEGGTRSNPDFSLKRKFVKIEGTATYICQVEKCSKVLHRCSRTEHLRAVHRLFPILECEKCCFKTFSRSCYNRHKKKAH